MYFYDDLSLTNWKI